MFKLNDKQIYVDQDSLSKKLAFTAGLCSWIIYPGSLTKHTHGIGLGPSPLSTGQEAI